MLPPLSRSLMTAAWPTFVLQEEWDVPPAVNRRLHELGAADALRHRVTDDNDPAAIGPAGGHVSHRRHNFFMEMRDPAIALLTRMIDCSVRKYLRIAYQYDYAGEIVVQSDTFHQRRAFDENTGVPTHNHHAHEFSCVYYPRVDGWEGKSGVLKSGALRIYDPAFRGDRLWPNRNPAFFARSHMVLQIRPGTMVVFEGHVPHDSTTFDGDERLCIAALCKLCLPNRHRWHPVAEILAYQDGANAS